MEHLLKKRGALRIRGRLRVFLIILSAFVTIPLFEAMADNYRTGGKLRDCSHFCFSTDNAISVDVWKKSYHSLACQHGISR